MVDGPVDREGLEYGIKIRDEFSKNVREFREGIEKSRESFRAFKSDLQKSRAQVQSLQRAHDRFRKSAAAVSSQSAKDAQSSRNRVKAFEREARARRELLAVEQRQRAVQRAADSARQKEVRRAKEEAEALRRTLQPMREVRDAIRKRTEAERAGQKVTGKSVALSLQHAKALQAEAAALAQVAAQQVNRTATFFPSVSTAGAGAAADPAALKGLEARAQQLEAQVRRLQEQLQLRGADRGSRRARALRGELLGVEGAAVSAGAGIRRLVVLFGGFLLVQRVLRTFREALTTGIQFNAQIEESVLGIQSILVSTGRIFDAQGRGVEGAEAFAAAQRESVRQVRLLRVEGLQTAATFEQLLDTFQTALAPGLAAGLSPDQIRQFAVRISQSASAIGLPQNQLAEEIRSILSGTITARSTRIAVALGITNEDINRAKEAGELADFLLTRFAAFETAGEKALNNYSTIISNLKDAVSQLLGEGTAEFFGEIKQDLQGITSALITQGDQGLVINPDAVAIVKAFVAGLSEARRQAHQIADELTLEDAKGAANALGTTIGGIAQIASTVGRGLIEGLRDAVRIARAVGDALGLEGLGSDEFRESLRGATRLLTVVLAIKLGVRALLLPLSLIGGSINLIKSTAILLLAPVRTLVKLFGLAKAAVLLLTSPFLIIGGLIAAAVAVFKSDFIRSIEIGGVKIGTLADLIKADLTFAIRKVALFFQTAWARAIAGVQILWKKLIQFFTNVGFAVIKAVLKAASIFSDDAERALENLRKAQKRFNDDQNSEIREKLRELGREERQLQRLKKAEDERREAARKAAFEFQNQGGGRTPQQAFKEAVDGLLGLVSGTEEVKDTTTDVVEETKTLLDVIMDVGIAVTAANQNLEDQRKIVSDLARDARQAEDDLSFAKAASGLDGVAQKIRKVFFESRLAFGNATEDLQRRIEETQTRLRALDTQQGRILRDAAQVPTADGQRDSADLLRSQVESARTLLSLTQDRARLEARAVALRRALSTADPSTQGRVAADLAAVESRLGLINRRITDNNKAAEATLALAVKDKDQRERIRNLVVETLELERNRKLTAAELADLDQQTADIRDQVRRKELADLERIARQESDRLRASNARFQLEVRAEQERLRISGQRARSEEARLQQEVALVQAQVQLERSALELEAQTRAAEIEALRVSLGKVESEQARAAIQVLINEKLREQNLLLADGDTRIQSLIQRLRELQQAIADRGDLGRGIADGIQSFIDTNTFQRAGQSIGRSIGNALSDSITTVLSFAFDPNQNQSLGQAIGNIGISLLKTVIDALTKAAVAKFILAPLGLGFAEGGAIGFAGGGEIPDSPYHGRRPRGLDPRDTVPIWAQKGEHMIRERIARHPLVRAFLDRLNAGEIDPVSLRGLASIRSHHRMRRAMNGYAEGGPIEAAGPSRRSQATEAVSAESVMQVLPTILADEQTLSRILAGGDAEMKRYLRENADVVLGESKSAGVL